jgi:hypothetical protein
MSLPLENLDNKTFEELVEEAKKRIPIYAPQWTDHNLHDPGITLIELFAWLLEMQVYRLNQVPDASYWNFLKLIFSPEELADNQELQSAILKARIDMKTVHRAVTPGDYEVLALSTAEVNVARAKALPRFHPNQHQEVPQVVTVVVVPDPAEKTAGSKFLNEVYSHLHGRLLLNTRLFVTLPLYIKVGVKAAVVSKTEYLGSTKVIDNVKEALENFLDPLTGGPHGTGLPFGRPVYVSEIYEVIDRAAGVDHVKTDSVELKKEGEDWQKHDIRISRHSLVELGEQDITAE